MNQPALFPEWIPADSTLYQCTHCKKLVLLPFGSQGDEHVNCPKRAGLWVELGPESADQLDYTAAQGSIQ